MASNTTLNSGTGGDVITTKERTHDGDATKQQVVALSGVSGTEGAYTFVDVAAGGGTEATALRVTLATDSTGVVSIDDNGSSLTVDGTVELGATSLAALESLTTISTVTTVGTVTTLTGTTSLTPGTAAANLGKAEDAAHSSGDVGVMILGVRNDAGTALAGTTGDYIPLSMDANGAVRVVGSAGTTQYTEDGASAGGESLCLMGAVRRDSAASSSGTDGDYSTLNTDATGNLRVAVSAGGVAGVVEDAVASGSAEGILGIVVRDDALATLTPVDGDYTAQRVNARGATWVALDSTAAQTVTLAAGTATNEVVGDAAHDAAIAGNPVRIGARAMSADFTAVATGDTTDVLATLTGKLVTTPYALPGSTWSYAAASGGLTNTTAVTIKAAGAAGVRNYLTSIQVINGHATVSTEVLVRDGAAGTVLHRGWAQAAGGGFAALFDPPLRGTAATLLEVVNVTTGSAVYVNAQGFSAAE